MTCRDKCNICATVTVLTLMFEIHINAQYYAFGAHAHVWKVMVFYITQIECTYVIKILWIGLHASILSTSPLWEVSLLSSYRGSPL